MTLALIRQFITSNLDRLGQQLSLLEQNVAAETSELAASKMAQPGQLVFTPGSPVTQALTVGQIALCDTNGGPVKIPLTAPSDGLPGFLWVVRRAAANAVTLIPGGLSPAGVARTINKVSSWTYGGGAASGPFTLYFDGSNWWSV